MNINPFIDLIAKISELYNFLLIVWIISSLLIQFNILNSYQPFVQRMMKFFSSTVEVPLRYIRKYIQPVAGIDLSPIIMMLLLQFFNNFLYSYLYT